MGGGSSEWGGADISGIGGFHSYIIDTFNIASDQRSVISLVKKAIIWPSGKRIFLNSGFSYSP